MVTEQGSKSVNEAIKTVSDAGTMIRTLADIIAEAVQAAAQIAASSAQHPSGHSPAIRSMGERLKR